MGGEKGEGMERGRERKVLFTEVPQDYQAMVILGGGKVPSPSHQPRMELSCVAGVDSCEEQILPL